MLCPPQRLQVVAPQPPNVHRRARAVRVCLVCLLPPHIVILHHFRYVFVALLVGLMYLQVPDTVAAGSFDRVSAVWFSLAILSFTPSYTSCVVWGECATPAHCLLHHCQGILHHCQGKSYKKGLPYKQIDSCFMEHRCVCNGRVIV